MNTLADQWEKYRAAVLHPKAPPNQIIETRRAFYAGALATLTLQIAVIGHPDISEAAALALIQSWHDECASFARQVTAGQA
jgi:hypothetical protein